MTVQKTRNILKVIESAGSLHKTCIILLSLSLMSIEESYRPSTNQFLCFIWFVMLISGGNEQLRTILWLLVPFGVVMTISLIDTQIWAYFQKLIVAVAPTIIAVSIFTGLRRNTTSSITDHSQSVTVLVTEGEKYRNRFWDFGTLRRYCFDVCLATSGYVSSPVFLLLLCDV